MCWVRVEFHFYAEFVMMDWFLDILNRSERMGKLKSRNDTEAAVFKRTRLIFYGGIIFISSVTEK